MFKKQKFSKSKFQKISILLKQIKLLFTIFRKRVLKNFNGEFDPGSGRTLAVCLTHASRTRSYFCLQEYDCSGGRVRNT